MMTLILLLSGCFFVAYGISLTVFANFTFGTVAVYILGIVLIIAAKVKFSKMFIYFTVSGVAVVLAFCIFLGIYGSVDRADYDEDVVIVLGAALRGDVPSAELRLRLDQTAEYYKKNSDIIIIVSGGMGAQETVTESSAMKKYLTQKGIPQSIIIEENKATNTYENLKFSKRIADRILGRDYKTVVITSGFHTLRAGFIADDLGIRHKSSPSPIRAYTALPNYLRECAAIVKYFVF